MARFFALLSLLHIGVISGVASSPEFAYYGSVRPSANTRMVVSSFDKSQSACIKAGGVVSNSFEQCCEFVIGSSVASAQHVDVGNNCDFSPKSLLAKSTGTWQVDAMVYKSSGTIKYISASTSLSGDRVFDFSTDWGVQAPCTVPNVGLDQPVTPGAKFKTSKAFTVSIPNMKDLSANWAGPTINYRRAESVQINVDPGARQQLMLGFGAAMTQASAFVLLETKKRDSDQYWKILRQLYSPTEGLGMNIVRIPIGVSDFAVDPTFYDGTPGTQWHSDRRSIGWGDMSLPKKDVELVLPVLKDIRDVINSNIVLYTEAWALPWWMGAKVQDNNWWGEFDSSKTEYAGLYFARAANLWKEQGFTVKYVGMINEPLVGPGAGGGVGMQTTPAQEAAISGVIRRYLDSNGMGDSKIVAYAHNWNQPSYPLEVLRSPNARVDIVSWHCYESDKGGPDATEIVRREFGNVQHIMGECTPTHGTQPQMMEFWDQTENGGKRIFWDSIRHGIAAVVEWNVVLDRATDTGLNFFRNFDNRGCNSCRGVINSLESRDYREACATPEYFVMRQYAPFLASGSFFHVGSTEQGCVYSNHFSTEDRNAVVVVVFNMCSDARSVSISVGSQGGRSLEMNGLSAATVVFEASTNGIVKIDGNIPFQPRSNADSCTIVEALHRVAKADIGAMFT
ncbi:glycoside hydrolase superfamily [Cladochytrium replicatum]|nr:glycoside hydrolase superfamily [Cladochytrium replicatum]